MEYQRLLKRGMTGSDVRYIKDALVSLGFLEKSTHDTFGSQTAEAVRAYQRTRSDLSGTPLLADGVVGQKTWAAIARDLAELSDAPDVIPANIGPTAARAIHAALSDMSGARRDIVTDDQRDRGRDVDAGEVLPGPRPSGAEALEQAQEELRRETTQKRAEAAQRLAENRAALAEESERITRELEPQLSDLALDLVNHLQHWQDDRHSAVDAETIAAPYADIEHLTAGEHTNATTNRTK